MIILFTFISLLGGLAYGIFGFHIPAVSLILKNTDGVLYALMFFVGISIGMHRGILSKIREYHIKNIYHSRRNYSRFHCGGDHLFPAS